VLFRSELPLGGGDVELDAELDEGDGIRALGRLEIRAAREQLLAPHGEPGRELFVTRQGPILERGARVVLAGVLLGEQPTAHCGGADGGGPQRDQDGQSAHGPPGYLSRTVSSAFM